MSEFIHGFADAWHWSLYLAGWLVFAIIVCVISSIIELIILGKKS